MTLTLFLLLAACPEPTLTPEVAPVAPPPFPPAPAAPAEPTAHVHGSGAGNPAADHAHAASHGGEQKEIAGGHVEALLLPDGVMVYLTDADNQAVPASSWTGSAVVNGPSGVTQVDLVPMGDHLHAPAKLERGKPAAVVLTLTQDGKAQSVSFETRSAGLETHAHTSLHGGQVGMFGNWHVELVAKDGEYRVWLSDANREERKAGLTGAVKEGEKTIALTQDASGTLSARSEVAGTLPITVEIEAEGQKISLPFGVP